MNANERDGPLAQHLAGKCAVVTTLIGPGVVRQGYAAKPADADTLATAELVLFVNQTLEERLAVERTRAPPVDQARDPSDRDDRALATVSPRLGRSSVRARS